MRISANKAVTALINPKNAEVITYVENNKRYEVRIYFPSGANEILYVCKMRKQVLKHMQELAEKLSEAVIVYGKV